MEKEFIVETSSGSLYSVVYNRHFFEHGGRFICRQLLAKTKTLPEAYTPVIAFRGKGGSEDIKSLDIKHFVPGVEIMLKPGGHTGPIVKIFQRVA